MADPLQILQPYAALIREKAERYGLDPRLLAGLVWFESGGQPKVRSAAGAVGLGQVMPREAGFAGRPTAKELEDPATNLDWSARILSEGINRWKTTEQGLAAYLGTINVQGKIIGGDPYTGVSGNQYVQRVLQAAGDVGERLLRATAGTAEAAEGEGVTPMTATLDEGYDLEQTARESLGEGDTMPPTPAKREGESPTAAAYRLWIERWEKQRDQYERAEKRLTTLQQKRDSVGYEKLSKPEKSELNALLNPEGGPGSLAALDKQLQSTLTQVRTAAAQYDAEQRRQEGAAQTRLYTPPRTDKYILERNPDGTLKLDENGQPVMRRNPNYEPPKVAEPEPGEAELRRAQTGYYQAQTEKLQKPDIKTFEQGGRVVGIDPVTGALTFRVDILDEQERAAKQALEQATLAQKEYDTRRARVFNGIYESFERGEIDATERDKQLKAAQTQFLTEAERLAREIEQRLQETLGEQKRQAQETSRLAQSREAREQASLEETMRANRTREAQSKQELEETRGQNLTRNVQGVLNLEQQRKEAYTGARARHEQVGLDTPQTIAGLNALSGPPPREVILAALGLQSGDRRGETIASLVRGESPKAQGSASSPLPGLVSLPGSMTFTTPEGITTPLGPGQAADYSQGRVGIRPSGGTPLAWAPLPTTAPANASPVPVVPPPQSPATSGQSRTYGTPYQGNDGIWHYPYTDADGTTGEDLSVEAPTGQINLASRRVPAAYAPMMAVA